MGKAITFINEKGGIGKTTLCFNTAWELSKRNNVLLIDLDGQRANLTYYCGVEKTDDLATICDLLRNKKKISEVIKNVKENLDIIPADIEVSDLSNTYKASAMKQLISTLLVKYDYILLDVSPSPNWGQYLALVSSDFCIIPMLPEISNIEAANGVVETIEEIQDTGNPNLQTLGIVFNRNENRTIMGKQVRDLANQIAERLNTKVFDSLIRSSVSMGEIFYMHQGITDYDSKSPIAEDFRQFVTELEREVKKYGKA